jgi:hypothetical protein
MVTTIKCRYGECPYRYGKEGDVLPSAALTPCTGCPKHGKASHSLETGTWIRVSGNPLADHDPYTLYRKLEKITGVF